MTGEEAQQRTDTNALSLLGKCDVVKIIGKHENLLPLRCDPRRELVPTAWLRSRTARLSVANAPADRARHTYPETLLRLAPRHPA